MLYGICKEQRDATCKSTIKDTTRTSTDAEGAAPRAAAPSTGRLPLSELRCTLPGRCVGEGAPCHVGTGDSQVCLGDRGGRARRGGVLPRAHDAERAVHRRRRLRGERSGVRRHGLPESRLRREAGGGGPRRRRGRVARSHLGLPRHRRLPAGQEADGEGLRPALRAHLQAAGRRHPGASVRATRRLLLESPGRARGAGREGRRAAST